MTVVVDLGCATYAGHESLRTLRRRFRPETLYGFDPLLDLSGAAPPAGAIVEARAAWTFDGKIPLSHSSLVDATLLCLSERWIDSTAELVPCFDLAAWLERLLDETDDGVVVKMDVEGAEFVLIDELELRRLDERLELLLVEWHDRYIADAPQWRERLTAALRCPVEMWA